MSNVVGSPLSHADIQEAVAAVGMSAQELQDEIARFVGPDGGLDTNEMIREVAGLDEPPVSEAKIRTALARWNGGAPVSDGQFDSFVHAFGMPPGLFAGKGADPVITPKILDDVQTMLDRGIADAKHILAPSLATRTGAKEILESILSRVSPEAQAALCAVASEDPSSLFFFLTKNIDLLTAGNTEATLLQLLEVFQLQSEPVSRGFERGVGNSLPPQVAVSAMKPLNVESSHRLGMIINLFPPQRVTLGAYIDLQKVVRNLRMKSLQKRVRYKDPEDVWYRE